jgi:hypothetical protein
LSFVPAKKKSASDVFSIARDSMARSREVRRRACVLRAEFAAERRRRATLLTELDSLISIARRLTRPPSLPSA